MNLELFSPSRETMERNTVDAGAFSQLATSRNHLRGQNATRETTNRVQPFPPISRPPAKILADRLRIVHPLVEEFISIGVKYQSRLIIVIKKISFKTSTTSTGHGSQAEIVPDGL